MDMAEREQLGVIWWKKDFLLSFHKSLRWVKTKHYGFIEKAVFEVLAV